MLSASDYLHTLSYRAPETIFSREVEAFKCNSMSECKATIEVYAGNEMGLAICFGEDEFICALPADIARSLAYALSLVPEVQT